MHLFLPSELTDRHVTLFSVQTELRTLGRGVHVLFMHITYSYLF
jgi:hypothetical protein